MTDRRIDLLKKAGIATQADEIANLHAVRLHDAEATGGSGSRHGGGI